MELTEYVTDASAIVQRSVKLDAHMEAAAMIPAALSCQGRLGTKHTSDETALHLSRFIS